MSVHMKKHLTELEIEGKKIKIAKKDKVIILSLVDSLKYDNIKNFLIQSENILIANRKDRPRGAIYLKSLRLRMNISQEELSKKTKISITNISAYENGRRKITENIAKRFAEKLNITSYKKLLT